MIDPFPFRILGLVGIVCPPLRQGHLRIGINGDNSNCRVASKRDSSRRLRIHSPLEEGFSSSPSNLILATSRTLKCPQDGNGVVSRRVATEEVFQ